MTDKKRNKHLKLLNFSVMLLLASAVLYLCSAIFLGAYAETLAEETRSIENKISVLEAKNAGIRTEINLILSSEDSMAKTLADTVNTLSEHGN